MGQNETTHAMMKAIRTAARLATMAKAQKDSQTMKANRKGKSNG